MVTSFASRARQAKRASRGPATRPARAVGHLGARTSNRHQTGKLDMGDPFEARRVMRLPGACALISAAGALIVIGFIFFGVT